jgi:hypothetical protein
MDFTVTQARQTIYLRYMYRKLLAVNMAHLRQAATHCGIRARCAIAHVGSYLLQRTLDINFDMRDKHE